MQQRISISQFLVTWNEWAKPKIFTNLPDALAYVKSRGPGARETMYVTIDAIDEFDDKQRNEYQADQFLQEFDDDET